MGGDASFPTTHWSMVVNAGRVDDTVAPQALATLCEIYWYPIYARIRHMVKDPEAARDLTQGFFAELLEKRTFDVADPEKGKFRWFLSVLVKRYMAHEYRKGQAVRRGGGIRHFELDFSDAEKRYSRDPVDFDTPESLFEKLWARTMLGRALGKLKEEMREAGNTDRFNCFAPLLTARSEYGSYGKLAVELGMSESAVKTAIHRLRKRYGELLRAEVADTVADSGLVDPEVRYLFSVLSS